MDNTAIQQTSSNGPQRRWPRYHFDVPIRLTFPVSGITRMAAAKGQELNAGGMGITTHFPLQVGEEVLLEFSTPFLGLPIRVRARVRNRAGSYFGMAFMAASRAEELDIALLRQTLISYATQLSVSRA